MEGWTTEETGAGFDSTGGSTLGAASTGRDGSETGAGSGDFAAAGSNVSGAEGAGAETGADGTLGALDAVGACDAEDVCGAEGACDAEDACDVEAAELLTGTLSLEGGRRRTTAGGGGGAAETGDEGASDSGAPERGRALRLTTVGAMRSSTTFSPVSRLRWRLTRSTTSGATALMWFLTSLNPTDCNKATSALLSMPKSRATS